MINIINAKELYFLLANKSLKSYNIHMEKNDKRMIIVFEGPSGVGKDTVIKGVIDKFPELFVKAPSTTTRDMREGEFQGSPYFFVNDDEFLKKVNSGDIFEHTVRHGTYRGMSKKIFDDILDMGKFPLKDCDMVGVKALRKIYGKKVVGVFISAPKENVKQRLFSRGDSPEEVEKRLEDFDNICKQKIYYEYEIQNIDLQKAVEEIINIITNHYEKL